MRSLFSLFGIVRATTRRSESFTTMVTTRQRATVTPIAARIDTNCKEFPSDDLDGVSLGSPPLKRSRKSTSNVTIAVEELFRASGMRTTVTKAGWCLQEGMTSILSADKSGQLLPIVQKQGLPAIYSIVEDTKTCRHDKENSTSTSTAMTKPQDCFQSLCRIIAGQQLAGGAARAMWHRLINVVATTTQTISSNGKSKNKISAKDSEDNVQALTPESILYLADRGFEEFLRKPAGLSNAKARSIVALAQAFVNGDVEESFLTSSSSTEEDIRSKLLPIKGIGPWTCDMFLMFYLEKGNVLPVGDLGVRKGIAKYFGLKGKGYKGSLCNIKDKDVMERTMAPYQPYQSLISYYMWAVADTKDFYRDNSTK